MESICRLLSYVNGQLDDESDDIIDDSVMYLIFLRLAAANRDVWPPQGLHDALDAVLAGYQEPCPGARHRVADVLEVTDRLVFLPAAEAGGRNKCSSWAFDRYRTS